MQVAVMYKNFKAPEQRLCIPRRAIVCGIALYAALSIVFAHAQTSSPLSLNQSRDAWHVCIAKEAIKLDDGISPASDIASALQVMCEKEHSAMLDRMTVSPETRYRLSQDRIANTKEVAIRLVLQIRAERRSASSK